MNSDDTLKQAREELAEILDSIGRVRRKSLTRDARARAPQTLACLEARRSIVEARIRSLEGCE